MQSAPDAEFIKSTVFSVKIISNGISFTMQFYQLEKQASPAKMLSLIWKGCGCMD